MCELLGMSFNQPVRPNISFKGFRSGGSRNPHGWGLAFYPDESAQVFKEPLRADVSILSEYIGSYPYIESKIILSHVRLSSSGLPAYKNTHPFHRELLGREYVFAHNGTLNDYTNHINSVRFRPIGDTDSELAFCWLLSQIENRNIVDHRWSQDDFAWLQEQLTWLNNFGKLNLIFSDGIYLFCYHNLNGPNRLVYTERLAPFASIILIDDDTEVNLAEEKDPEQKGFIVATRRLTNENWIEFCPGELKVFKDGIIEFSSANRSTSNIITEVSLTSTQIDILRFVRRQPYRVNLKYIRESLHLSTDEITEELNILTEKGYIKQDSRDIVSSDNGEATFYTELSKRLEIDEII